MTHALTLLLALGAAGPSDFNAELDARRAELVALWHDLHRHPELSGAEERTAGVVAAQLSAHGLTVRTGVGGHGVVAVLTGARPGRVVAYRADMDAVRSSEPDPVDFRSVVAGVRHICGHDLHTTIGIALAQGLAAQRESLAGTVIFLFQPAEEAATGARAMLADGAFADLRPSAIFALHAAPLEVGTFETAEGVLMAARDRARLDFSAAGAAEARAFVARIEALATLTPEQALAPAARTDLAVETDLSASGAGRWRLVATFSSGAPETLAGARAALEGLVRERRQAGLELTLDYTPRVTPGVSNDRALARAAARHLEDELGADRVSWSTTVVPAFSEDFGAFQEEVPGVMFFLGVARASAGVQGMPHTPNFATDEEALFLGARAMAAVLLGALAAD